MLYRFSEDEVTLHPHLRPALLADVGLGLAGGGPMNDQQIDNLIAYLKSIQLPQEGCTKDEPLCKTAAGDPVNGTDQGASRRRGATLVAEGEYESLGEALFNLDLGGGAYSCARCHTKGWTYGDPQQSGGGAIGPNLTNGAAVRQFPTAADQRQFIARAARGRARSTAPRARDRATHARRSAAVCSRPRQIKAIVEYERSL